MSALIEQERQRRADLWDAVLALGGPDGLTASDVNDKGLRLVAGGRGFYVDIKRTRPLSDDGHGLTVGFSVTGRVYADDIDDEGVIYHYPQSKESHRSRDEQDIAATKSCAKHQLPVFVVIKEGGKRNVRRGWVKEWDDDERYFLVLFGEDEEPEYEPVDDHQPFEPFGDPLKEGHGKKKSRPNSVRFRHAVMDRYGIECAFCPIREWGVLDAAHLIGKEHEGSDDPRNGLPLCATHHRAIGEKRALLRMDPETLEVVADGGATLESLRVTKTNLNHLPNTPHKTALKYLWDKQEANKR